MSVTNFLKDTDEPPVDQSIPNLDVDRLTKWDNIGTLANEIPALTQNHSGVDSKNEAAPPLEDAAVHLQIEDT